MQFVGLRTRTLKRARDLLRRRFSADPIASDQPVNVAGSVGQFVQQLHGPSEVCPERWHLK